MLDDSKKLAAGVVWEDDFVGKLHGKSTDDCYSAQRLGLKVPMIACSMRKSFR